MKYVNILTLTSVIHLDSLSHSRSRTDEAGDFRDWRGWSVLIQRHMKYAPVTCPAREISFNESRRDDNSDIITNFFKSSAVAGLSALVLNSENVHRQERIIIASETIFWCLNGFLTTQ